MKNKRETVLFEQKNSTVFHLLVIKLYSKGYFYKFNLGMVNSIAFTPLAQVTIFWLVKELLFRI